MLTDEELTAIRTRLTLYQGIVNCGTDEEWREIAGVYYEDIPALLAEVERLRAELSARQAENRVVQQNFAALQAENTAMREIVQAVANLPLTDFGDCVACGAVSQVGENRHDETCPVSKARALLAAQ